MQNSGSKFSQHMYQKVYYFSVPSIAIIDGLQETSNAFFSVRYFVTLSPALQAFFRSVPLNCVVVLTLVSFCSRIKEGCSYAIYIVMLTT